jgi:hypothetical protein
MGGGNGHAYLKEDEMLLASAHLKNNQLLHDCLRKRISNEGSLKGMFTRLRIKTFSKNIDIQSTTNQTKSMENNQLKLSSLLLCCWFFVTG